MDDWITNYYDVPASCNSSTVETPVENDPYLATNDQKPGIKCCYFKYRHENFTDNVSTKIGLAAA